MIQFLFLPIFLFFNVLCAKDPYFKIESGDEYSYGKEIVEQYQSQKNSHLFASTAIKSPQFQNFYSNEECNTLLILAMLKARVGEAKFKQLMYDHHVQKYGVSSDFLWGSKTVKGLYKSRSFKTVADWIVDNKQLTQEQANNIWNGYCNKRCIGQKDKQKSRLRIEGEYNLREQKIAEQQKQRQEALVLQKKQNEQMFSEIYNDNLLLFNDYQSPYQNVRQQALDQTGKQGYKKYNQTHKLDEQAIGLCIANNIDYQKLQHCAGNAMQHQLYDEVADCYKKIAKFLCHSKFPQSFLAQHSLEFAQGVTQATELEAMELAIALSDLAHLCVDTANSVFVGVQESIHGIAEMVTNPVGTAKNLGYVLGNVMNYVAEAMQYADPETLGWSRYSQILEKEHQYDTVYANAIIDQMQDWIINSSGQEKIKFTSRLVADSILYPRFTALLSNTGNACCGVIAEIPEMKFLEGFIDVYGEYKLATSFGNVGLNGMQDVGKSLMKFEAKTFADFKSVQKAAKKFSSSTKVKDRVVFDAEKYKNYKPKEVKTCSLLDKNLKIAENAKNGAEYIRKLSDGRVRYYDAEKLASTPGPTRGSSHVTEYDPARGIIRAWRESYDHAGNVNRVHPKMMNGKNIDSLHYPHTGKELVAMVEKMKEK